MGVSNGVLYEAQISSQGNITYTTWKTQKKYKTRILFTYTCEKSAIIFVSEVIRPLNNSSRDGESTSIQFDVITSSNKMVAEFLISRDEEMQDSLHRSA